MVHAPAPAADIRVRMDRMYRPQKLLYDLTRKHYLIGRDRLIDGLDARPGERLLDLGCGTGRNLILAARRFPETRLFGLDAAAPMLEVATAKVRAERLGHRVRLARGVAEELDLMVAFGEAPGVDHVTISYALSMMDEPETCLDRALTSLRSGGRLHIVDFGPMDGMPGPARHALRAWLARFQVRHRPEVERQLRARAAAGQGTLAAESLLGGYARLLRFTCARGS